MLAYSKELVYVEAVKQRIKIEQKCGGQPLLEDKIGFVLQFLKPLIMQQSKWINYYIQMKDPEGPNVSEGDLISFIAVLM